jgi:hypothetical protein
MFACDAASGAVVGVSSARAIGRDEINANAATNATMRILVIASLLFGLSVQKKQNSDGLKSDNGLVVRVRVFEQS